jgi:polysaccharide export outer membrane protein
VARNNALDRSDGRAPPTYTLLMAYAPGTIRTTIDGRVAQLVRALLSHSRGPGFESLRVHWIRHSISCNTLPAAQVPMRTAFLRSLWVTALFLPLGSLAAQTLPGGVRPTPEQTQALLQSRPDLVEQLRQRMVTSGMTAEQIRARLKAEGYPENLLDSYLPGASGQAAAPNSSVLRAVQELGIADSLDLVGGTGQGALVNAQSRGDTGLLQRSESRFRPDTIRDRFARDSVIRLATSPDSGFVIFGLDVFRAATSQFQPNLAGPVDPGYRLGPGDRLVLILTGEVEESYSLDVTREGFVVIPRIGQVFVNNLTLGQLENLLYTRLGRAYSGIRREGGTTRFSLNVARLRSNQVFVVGDVQRPGSYTISSTGTALTALYAAGGPSVNGSLRRVEVRRAGRVTGVLDVYDYVLRGDATNDVRLETGDIVFVPLHGPRARVVGEVLRPATYEMKSGEGLPRLLEAAGGFTAYAARRRVLIERVVPSADRVDEARARTTVDISGTALANALGPNVPVQNGDVLRVFTVSERLHDRITVRGNVVTPGAQGLTPGMRVADALRAAGGIKPDTYFGEVLITRLEADSTRSQLRVRLRDSTGAVVNDLLLREDDQIQVFSLTAFRPERYVAIAGFVNNPGRFAYREGMTLKDLVLLAGGAKEGASLTTAEIARLPADRSNGQTAVTIQVPLDSSYLFERRAGSNYAGPPGQQASASGAPDAVLQPYDNVLILRQENFEYQRVVTVSGEVRFPGTYALKTKRDRLSDVLARAGGLTDEAQRDAILFVRVGPTEARIKNGSGTGTAQDSLLARRATNGRIGLDLAAVLNDPATRDNIALEDGDQITVPRYNPVVRVQGAVNAPANVTFVPGRDLFYYVDAAGGGSRIADEKRSFVTQPSGKLESVRGRFLLSDVVPQPQAGAVVTVPERDPLDKRDYAAIAAVATQLIASLVAVIAIIRR